MDCSKNKINCFSKEHEERRKLALRGGIAIGTDAILKLNVLRQTGQARRREKNNKSPG